ncbi:MAG: phage tail protein [Kofleriaceae bacterium]
MSSIFADGALHPGRDANDSSWLILRTPADWATAQLRDAIYDPARKVIELAPRPLAEDAMPALEVGDYKSDPDRDRVLVRCGDGFLPIPRFGGRGIATGRLRRPLGLALDDRGLLYVADSGNHRVQVIHPGDGAVEIVLGCTNAWGEPIAGTSGGAMTEPVDVAVGRAGIYVADRDAHAIHCFDRGFRWLRSITVTTPIAVDVAPDGSIIVVDAASTQILQFSADGTPLEGLGFAEGAPPHLVASARYARHGEVIVGPIDGRTEDLAWHRVIVDAALPAGTSIEVQTFATADTLAASPIPWAPALPVAIPLAGEREHQRPVLSDTGRWQRARHGRYRRAALQIADYDGDGPNAVASITLASTGLQRVRTGDVVELRAKLTTAIERVVVAAIPPRTVRFAVTGTTAVFAGGTTITLRERDTREPSAGPQMLAVLAAGETIDLAGVLTDGTLVEKLVPHGVQMLWRAGDVLELQDATGAATIVVEDLALGPTAIPLVTAPGDLRHSRAVIVETVDRLLLEELGGFDAQTPADEPIEIDGLTAGAPWTESATVRWVEPELGVLWISAAPTFAWADWESFTTPAPHATDRGRYLWLRLRLTGTAAATSTIRSVRLLRPRLSFLRYLPGTFGRRDAEDPSGALFLERLLAMIEYPLTGIEASYESIARQLDPFAADPEWLAFIASWFDLYLDPALPLERRRLLVSELHTLYATRGTPAGIRRYVEIVTGREPSIVEGFQIRPSSGIVLGCSGVLGCSELGGAEDLDRHAHRFTIYAFIDDPCALEATQAALQRLLATIIPAHTLVELHVVLPDARVDEQAMVGIDLVLGDGRTAPNPRPYPVLGLDAVITAP